MRKYLPTLAELIDRLSIAQLKEVFIPDHKKEYSEEIRDIVHDIQSIIDEKNGKITAETIRAIVVLSQMNLHIWHNESNYRKGVKDGNNLELTHGINGIRNTAKNKIQEIVGGRKDYKIDCLAAEFKDWEISWGLKSNIQNSLSEEFNRFLDYISDCRRNNNKTAAKVLYILSILKINSFEDFRLYADKDFLGKNGFGKKSWQELKNYLHYFGYEYRNNGELITKSIKFKKQ